MLWSHPNVFFGQRTLAVLSTFTTVATMGYMVWRFPLSTQFGGTILSADDARARKPWATTHARDGGGAAYETVADDDDHHDGPGIRTSSLISTSSPFFSTPFVPYLPCLGIFVNWYLIAQLDVSGILLLLLYIGLTVGLYLMSCARHSVGHRTNWHRHGSSGAYEMVPVASEEEEEEPPPQEIFHEGTFRKRGSRTRCDGDGAFVFPANKRTAHSQASPPEAFLLIENKAKSNNLGSLLRCACAFGVKTVVAVGYSQCSVEGMDSESAIT